MYILKEDNDDVKLGFIKDSPLWIVSASLSGISRLNSYYGNVSMTEQPPIRQRATYLFNGHHNLNSVQTVQSEIVCEVGAAVDLFRGLRP